MSTQGAFSLFQGVAPPYAIFHMAYGGGKKYSHTDQMTTGVAVS